MTRFASRERVVAFNRVAHDAIRVSREGGTLLLSGTVPTGTWAIFQNAKQTCLKFKLGTHILHPCHPQPLPFPYCVWTQTITGLC